MRPPNLTEAARVTRRLLDQYGPARLLRVEELAPGFSGGCWPAGPRPWQWSGRTDGSPSGRPSRGHKKSPGPFGSRGGRQGVYHENKCIIPWERVFDKGEFCMIPENLKESWQKVLARCELLFLADNGGGCPDCLAGLSPEEQVRTLRSLGFRVREYYQMPIDLTRPEAPDNLEPWIRLTNGVGVSLNHGFVSRAGRGKLYG